MKLESLENIEVISPSEYINDSVEPINEYNDGQQENISDSHENVENAESTENVENVESLESGNEMVELVTDLEVTEGIAEYLETVEELKFENWSKLSLSQRGEVLNSIEQHVAAIEHRPPLTVVLEDLPARRLGYHNSSEHKIALNTSFVGSNSRAMHRDIIETIIHEGRHAYQHYNVEVKPIHESFSEVMTWCENYYNPEYKYYQSGSQNISIRYRDGSVHDVDYRLYYYQPVEIDARNFSKDVLLKLEERGIVAEQSLLSQEKNMEAEANEFANDRDVKDEVQDSIKKPSAFESGFDAEHPFPTYEQLRNAGFDDKIANRILSHTSPNYSQKELFHCFYESDDPLKAYNEMMSKKVQAHFDKTQQLFDEIDRELSRPI